MKTIARSEFKRCARCGALLSRLCRNRRIFIGDSQAIGADDRARPAKPLAISESLLRRFEFNSVGWPARTLAAVVVSALVRIVDP